jgi:hypothetical protein
VSLNQWIATAVAQKVGVVETAAQFFRTAAQGATGGDALTRVLAKVPAEPPDPGDELPDKETRLASQEIDCPPLTTYCVQF